MPGAVGIILDVFDHYQLRFDEGVTRQGEQGAYGPYRQRQRARIYQTFAKWLVQQGKAVIMISSEIPELMGVCDRIMVMCEGNLSGEVKRNEFSQERIMTLASALEV